jgi:trehalose 6-phosphate synthase/phosphatase
MLRGLPYAVLRGSRTIEARPSMLTKSNVVSDLLERYAGAGFVFCAGNDPTDEGMFEVVLRSGRPKVFTCFVGGKDTIGQYFVESPADLIAELESLVALWSKMPAVRVSVERGLEIVDSGLTAVE